MHPMLGILVRTIRDVTNVTPLGVELLIMKGERCRIVALTGDRFGNEQYRLERLIKDGNKAKIWVLEEEFELDL